MIFERTYDFGTMLMLLRERSLYPFLTDDFSPAIEDVELPDHEAIRYILASEKGIPFGFWMFAPDNGNPITWSFHTVMALDQRALRAMHALLGRAGWLWSNTPCRRAITYVPEYNKIALRFGLRAGLAEFGRDPDSYQKNGQLHTRILLGVSKP